MIVISWILLGMALAAALICGLVDAIWWWVEEWSRVHRSPK